MHLFWGDTPERIAAEHRRDPQALASAHDREDKIGFGMRLQVICREREQDAWDAAETLVKDATDRQRQEIKTHYARSAANQRVQELAREYGDLIMPHLWTGITRVRPGAGIAVVGDPQQCAATLQQFIDAGCHSFCLSGYLHDEEAERFGRLIRPLLVAAQSGTAGGVSRFPSRAAGLDSPKPSLRAGEAIASLADSRAKERHLRLRAARAGWIASSLATPRNDE